MRVLIAEDDTTSQKILESVLTKWGHHVISTRDGNQAWEKLQSPDAPKLAILDWMMPGMSGVEVCRRVREADTVVPVYIILLTTLSGKEDVVAGLDAGADDYVTKPFDNAELRARLEVGQRVVKLQRSLAARIHELQDALDHVKTLQGILPICMHCHKIRTDKESWERIEGYISKHSDAQFSHGVCPQCRERYYSTYPDLLDRKARG